MDSDIWSACYVSRAKIYSFEVDSLVEASREKNERIGLTGGLLYTGAYFVQMIEGPEETLRAMMTAIARDKRHDLVTHLSYRDLPERAFSHWSMGFAVTPSAERIVAPLVMGRIPDYGLRDQLKELIHAHILH